MALITKRDDVVEESLMERDVQVRMERDRFLREISYFKAISFCQNLENRARPINNHSNVFFNMLRRLMKAYKLDSITGNGGFFRERG